jgi:hypothetical protein
MASIDKREKLSYSKGSKVYPCPFDARAYLSSKGVHDVYAVKNVIHKCSRGYFVLDEQLRSHIFKLDNGWVFGWKQTSNPLRKQEGVIGYIRDGVYVDAWTGARRHVGHVDARDLCHKPQYGNSQTGITRPDRLD